MNRLLAIFAVSAIVALVSVICLIRLAVSRAGDKKKIDLSGEESGHTASQVPQEKSVKQDSGSQIKVDSGTSSQDKSSVPTSPSQPPQARDTALSQVPQEKPVKQGSGSHIEVDSGTSSQDKSSVPTSPSQSPQTRGTAPPQVQHSVPPSPSSLSSGAVPPPPPPPLAPNSNGTPLPKKANSSSMSEGKVNGGANQENPRDAVFAQIRKKGFNLKHVEEDTQQVQPTIVNLPVVNPLISVLNTIREAKAPSESGSDHSNSWVSIENGHEQTEPEQAEKEQTKHTNPPLSKEEGSGGFDSGIGSRATSPLYSEQKTEESPVPPSSCVGSPSTAQVNNINPVNNEVQDPSTLPLKDRITKFGGEALQYQKQFVVQRSQVL